MQAFETKQLADPPFFDHPVVLDQGSTLSLPDHTVVHTTDDDPTEEVGVIKGRDLKLKRFIDITHRRGDVAQDRVE